MQANGGSLSEGVEIKVEAADILPLVRQHVYGEREVFLRELLSNAVDALEKLRVLSTEGHIDPQGPAEIEIHVDPLNRTIAIRDTGVGMTRDEVKQYLNQIAVSGAKDFISTQQKSQGQLIGQFGLGFYSAFMVSERVDVDTKSWQTAAEPVQWSYRGGTESLISAGSSKSHGTRIVCHLDDQSREFLEIGRIESVVRKYLDFVAYPIYLSGRQINEVNSPWHLKRDEQKLLARDVYYKLYQRLNPGANRPYDWLHIELDHPIYARALLFITSGVRHPNIRLFSNRTFISDNCHTLVPRWLSFVEGIIDTPDLPLNVARDKFQHSPSVVQLREILGRETVSFLVKILKERRADYQRFWDEHGTAIKQGVVLELASKSALGPELQSLLLFPSTRSSATTIDEYLDRKKTQDKINIIYSTDETSQQQHLRLHKNKNVEVLLLNEKEDLLILPSLHALNPGCNFIRVDEHEFSNETSPDISGSDPQIILDEPSWELLTDFFQSIVPEDVSGIVVEALPSRDIPAVLTLTQDGAKAANLQEFLNKNQGILNRNIDSNIRKKMLEQINSESVSKKKWILVINSNSETVHLIHNLVTQQGFSPLANAIAMQIWDQVQLGAGLLVGDRLYDALIRQNGFLALVVKEFLSAGRVEGNLDAN